MDKFLHGQATAIISNNPEDLVTFRRLLPLAGLMQDLLEFADAGDAASFFHEVALSSPDTVPGLVIVDLQSPHLSGFHFVWWLRSQRYFDATAVIVLTSATEKRHIATTRHLPNDHYVARYPTSAMIRRVYHQLVSGPRIQSLKSERELAPVVGTRRSAMTIRAKDDGARDRSFSSGAFPVATSAGG